MEYIELKCVAKTDNPVSVEILTAVLGDLGFESFVEEDQTLLAYIPSDSFTPSLINNDQITDFRKDFELSWNLIPDQNWNKVWEENFQPVTIDGKCHIRAPFHSSNKDVEYEIVIEPKMSFGTAHHETTAGMIQMILATEFKGKRVLDMGCGTGILAILAAMKGAGAVTAIDNDVWAYNNTLENTERNNTQEINVLLGDAALLGEQHFDIILANINRNILLSDIPVYSKCMYENGLLFLSGFYSEDLPAIKQMAGTLGLEYISHLENNRWVAASFRKIKP